MGAIGASFAAQMKDHGINPLVFCDEKRKSRYTKDGFIVNNKRYDFEYIMPGESVAASLVIVVVKHHNLIEVVEQIKDIVTPDTVIMSLMNGIDSETILGARYGMDKIVHAFVIALDGVREKNNISYTSPGQIIFGNADASEDWKIDRIKSFLKTASINYQLTDEILKKQWWKFMVNIGANQLSAILHAPYGTMKYSADARILLTDAMMEVIEISQAMNVNLEESSIADFFTMIGNLADDGKTSMHQDVLAKRKTEVDMLSGHVIALGKKYSIPTPVNTLLYHMIKTIEYQYIK
jgi:2-dehydropantoate 2-reductase